MVGFRKVPMVSFIRSTIGAIPRTNQSISIGHLIGRADINTDPRKTVGIETRITPTIEASTNCTPKLITIINDKNSTLKFVAPWAY
jgi:hypothetical protein